VKCAVCHHVIEGDAAPHHCPKCGEASFIGAPRSEHLEIIPRPPPDCPTFAEFIEHGYPADQYPPTWCKPPKKSELAKRDAWVKRHPRPKAKAADVVEKSDTVDPVHVPAHESHTAPNVPETVIDEHAATLIATHPDPVTPHPENENIPTVAVTPEEQAALAKLTEQPVPPVHDERPAPAPSDTIPVEHHEPVAPAAEPEPHPTETTAPHEGANEGTRT